ncbi:Rho GTPase-activating protein SYDE2 [Dissostichus eleginoides]|uniref:Rho GTPase-activating protein SYDE2 n=1 Tax=Dissostichus eleginoides TaxID=100907 RepID=A0AAD9EWC7_DISEL|nr:Rho GTPase-activating protein SYDE2 [Dissostichus eleginoides]
MAEPLLRRTFSRLRGRDRRDKLSALDPSSTAHHHITVAKIQSWARQGSVAPTPSLQKGSAPRTSTGVSQHAPRLGQRLQGQKESCGGVMCGGSAPCLPASPAPPAGGSSEGQRSYLQSLERSSRAWVLSSQGGGNIWYNPIPEEEGGAGPPPDGGGAGPTPEGGRVWRRREELRGGRPAESPAEGANPSVSHQTDDITEHTGETDDIKEHTGETDDITEHTGETDDITEHTEHTGETDDITEHTGETDDITEHTDETDDITEHTDSAPSDSSPASIKKGGVSSSVIDRLRSPGTVRKLSMKMKKLPELRRKLSLRSTRGRGGDSRAGGDESTSKNTASSTSDQNVISRYHLDSSAPPARPLRRSSRGRSAKGGYLSDGDSPELLPRQQAPPLASPQETCDVSSFQMYSGIEPPRNSQRVTGLLTVHLLGLEELKSSGCSGSKQVFLAIQVDGVTRARTSQLTLRGSALPLNHAFHLQLERARLLRLLLLTPAPPAGGPSDPPPRNRVCALGGVCIPPLFKGSRSQQLCQHYQYFYCQYFQYFYYQYFYFQYFQYFYCQYFQYFYCQYYYCQYYQYFYCQYFQYFYYQYFYFQYFQYFYCQYYYCQYYYCQYFYCQYYYCQYYQYFYCQYYYCQYFYCQYYYCQYFYCQYFQYFYCQYYYCQYFYCQYYYCQYFYCQYYYCQYFYCQYYYCQYFYCQYFQYFYCQYYYHQYFQYFYCQYYYCQYFYCQYYQYFYCQYFYYQYFYCQYFYCQYFYCQYFQYLTSDPCMTYGDPCMTSDPCMTYGDPCVTYGDPCMIPL